MPAFAETQSGRIRLKSSSKSVMILALLALAAPSVVREGARAPAGAESRLFGAMIRTQYPKWLDAEELRYGGETYVVVRMKHTGMFRRHEEREGRQHEEESESRIAFKVLERRANRWCYAKYREAWAKNRRDAEGRRLKPVPPAFFDRFERFDAIVKNPRDKLLLFKGPGLGKLIGMMEFTHADGLHALSPTEQAHGIRFDRDQFDYNEKWGVFGRTIEINKVVADEEYRGVAAPLLWAEAARGDGILNGAYTIGLNVHELARFSERIRAMDPKGGVNLDLSSGNLPVTVGRFRLRCHKSMVPYYERLGFVPETTPFRPLTERELAQEKAAQIGSPSEDDRILVISREELEKVPSRIPGKIDRVGGVEIAQKAERTNLDFGWVYRQLLAEGLEGQERHEALHMPKAPSRDGTREQFLEWKKRTRESRKR